jgi:hypothetical protein
LLKTVKIDQFLIQNSIIKIWRKTKKTSNIIGLSFDISYLSIVFLFKIQILNENNKPISFPVYHLVFLIYRSIFQFSFFQKNKSNRPVFNESTKLDQTNFIDFHEKMIFGSMVTLHAGLTPRVQGMARGRANTGVSCAVLPSSPAHHLAWRVAGHEIL